MDGSRAPRVAVFMKHYKVCPPPLHVYLDFLSHAVLVPPGHRDPPLCSWSHAGVETEWCSALSFLHEPGEFMPFLMSGHPQAGVCEPLPFLRVPAGYVGRGGGGLSVLTTVLLPEWCPGTRPPPLCWNSWRCHTMRCHQHHLGSGSAL